MRHSKRKLNLTGQRFGRLTVLGPAENIGDRTAWLCQCDCGKKVITKTMYLRNGHTVSCGCTHAAALRNLTFVDGTCVEMLRAKTVRKNNTSGVPGVDWQRRKKRWRASICFKGKRYYLGSYICFEDAVKARQYAEAEMHDRFLKEFSESDPPGNAV